MAYTQEPSAVYKLKTIEFLRRKVPIVVQNENGPCPLLALANNLLLRNLIYLPPNAPEVQQVGIPIDSKREASQFRTRHLTLRRLMFLYSDLLKGKPSMTASQGIGGRGCAKVARQLPRTGSSLSLPGTCWTPTTRSVSLPSTSNTRRTYSRTWRTQWLSFLSWQQV